MTKAVTVAAATPAEKLKVAGITPFSSIDFPGRLAAVAFIQGCPWKCVYCQNRWMQSRGFHPNYDHASWAELEALLTRRVGLLDGVVFSGGEPTLDPALPAAVDAVRSLGLHVGLHTAGMYPAHLAAVIQSVDWVGLDVKASPDDAALYDRITGRNGSAALLKQSFGVIADSGVSYEARTTAHPDFLTPESIVEAARWLSARGTTHFALQIYRQAPGVEENFSRVASDYPGLEIERELERLFPRFVLRRT